MLQLDVGFHSVLPAAADLGKTHVLVDDARTSPSRNTQEPDLTVNTMRFAGSEVTPDGVGFVGTVVRGLHQSDDNR